VKLHEIVAERISDDCSLRGVSQPVIDAVCRQCLTCVCDIIVTFPTGDLDSDNWQVCEGCHSPFIVGENGHLNEDAIPFCNECANELATLETTT
jgi:hypothetical protein